MAPDSPPGGGVPIYLGKHGQAPGSQPLLEQACSHMTSSGNPEGPAACPSLRDTPESVCVSASRCE